MATPTPLSIITPTPGAQSDRFYTGQRTVFGVTVHCLDCYATGNSTHSRSLPPRFDLQNHSPDGFEWGYGGSGPSQLALALLASLTGDDAYACAMYQTYKWEVVCALPKQGWVIDGPQLREWVAQHPLEEWEGKHPLHGVYQDS